MQSIANNTGRLIFSNKAANKTGLMNSEKNCRDLTKSIYLTQLFQMNINKKKPDIDKAWKWACSRMQKGAVFQNFKVEPGHLIHRICAYNACLCFAKNSTSSYLKHRRTKKLSMILLCTVQDLK